MALHLVEDSNVNDITSMLQTMGYQYEYIQRAITVHNKSKLGTHYDLSMLIEIISRLQSKDKSQNNSIQQQTTFTPNLTQPEALKLTLLDTIDFRFENGRFVLCKIISKQTNIILLHPLALPITITKHDRYCNTFSEYYNLALPKSISLRKSTFHSKYKIDDYIDINPLYKQGHQGWKYGRIVKIDSHSSQIKIFYHNCTDNKYYSYWFHIDNKNEIAIYNSKCKINDDIDSGDSAVEHTENNDSIHHSPLIHPKEPKYSFLYDSIQSGLSNNSLQGIDYNNNNGLNMPKQKNESIPKDITSQLNKFGYKNIDIENAQKQISNPNDINEIVDHIQKHKDDKVVHEQWDSGSQNMNTFDEQYCNVGTYDVSDMFEDAISEIGTDNENDEDEKKEYESSPSFSENNLSEYGNDDDDDENNNNGLFGINPMRLNGTMIPGTDYNTPIPNILIWLKNKLFMSNSHLFENIFAIERDKQIINNMITIMSNNNIQILNNIHGLDGYIVANLITEWYKQLPMPIINSNNINIKEIKLIKNIQMAGEYIENKMNKPYQTYFKWLLDLMIDIIINEKINKMSIKNICDVMDKNLCQNENISKFLQLCVLWRRFNWRK